MIDLRHQINTGAMKRRVHESDCHRELPFRCKEVHDISWKMASEQVAE